LTKYINI